ncbi:MAG: hypothetical protein ACRD2I_11390, partial [Vicinamibacterales bacterium]
GAKLLAVTLLGMLAVSVLMLSSAGIYAVVSQSVQERRQCGCSRVAGLPANSDQPHLTPLQAI